jgi:hypothetical protein
MPCWGNKLKDILGVPLRVGLFSAMPTCPTGRVGISAAIPNAKAQTHGVVTVCLIFIFLVFNKFLQISTRWVNFAFMLFLKKGKKEKNQNSFNTCRKAAQIAAPMG